MKRFLTRVLQTFFCEKSTFYSVYVATPEGEKPLCKWFRGLNPPRIGELIAIEMEDTIDNSINDKKFEYYKIISIANIFYRSKVGKDGIISGKKEATILVKYIGEKN